MITPREKFSWALTTILALAGVFTVGSKMFDWVDARHDPMGAAQTVLEATNIQSSAIVLKLESANQNARNHYLALERDAIENKDKATRDEAREQLKRLEYDRSGIVELKEQVLKTK